MRNLQPHLWFITRNQAEVRDKVSPHRSEGAKRFLRMADQDSRWTHAMMADVLGIAEDTVRVMLSEFTARKAG